jgi:hypothetical protein
MEERGEEMMKGTKEHKSGNVSMFVAFVNEHFISVSVCAAWVMSDRKQRKNVWNAIV